MQTYSRISKKQRRTIVVQSGALVLSSFGLIALFAFVLVPATFRLFGMQNKPVIQEKDTLPPIKAQINPLPPATNSAQITISGLAEASTTVALLRNENAIQESTALDSGEFMFPNVQLAPGENTFSIRSTDATGNESVSEMAQVLYSAEPPKLDVSQPTNGAVITRRRDQVVTVQGSTDKNGRVFVNDKVALVDPEGKFSSLFQLQDGSNLIMIRALNEAGNETKIELTVTFQP